MDRLKNLGWKSDPQTCMHSNNAFVLDIKRWRQHDITSKFEGWFDRGTGKYFHVQKDKGIQPLWSPHKTFIPWTLALQGVADRLMEEWYCPGLSRRAFQDVELDKFLKPHRKRDVMAAFGIDPEVRKPYASICSKSAYILHFDGEMRPWEQHQWFVGP